MPMCEIFHIIAVIINIANNVFSLAIRIKKEYKRCRIAKGDIEKAGKNQLF